MTDEQKIIETEQLKKLREQQEEIMQLQSQVKARTDTPPPPPPPNPPSGTTLPGLETPTSSAAGVAIPDPESVVQNLNVFEQLNESGGRSDVGDLSGNEENQEKMNVSLQDISDAGEDEDHLPGNYLFIVIFKLAKV